MKNLWLLFPALLLAACHGGPPPAPPVVAAPAPPRLAQGIDVPTDIRDVSGELRTSRLDFVARYYRNPDSHWPALSPAEAETVSAAGIKLVALWESYSHLPEYFSYARGYYDALSAFRQAKAIGQPPGSAIYFAVDFNARPEQITGPIDRYFRGIAVGLAAADGGRAPPYRVGVYGSGAVCAYLKGAGLAQYAWLSNSTAWAGYRSFTDWDIRQGGRSPSLSFSQDSNEARGNYGGFRVASEYSSLSLPTVDPPWPTTATTSSPASCAANCPATRSMKTSMFSPSATSAPRRRSTSS
jgi:Rv2525c-like, glycoside hydrolase-like domain